MRITVYFVRHAEAQSNVHSFVENEDNLTDTGIHQSQLIAERFKNVSIDKIYVSDILRAQQTANEIGRVKKINPETLEFLQEGKTTDAFDDLKSRLIKTKKFLENSRERHLLVVCHAIFLKALVAYFLLKDSLTNELLNKIQDVLVAENSGVSKFVFNKEKSKWRMMLWNDTAHLEGV